MSVISIEPLTFLDLPAVSQLQPPDWNDITLTSRFHIESPFCNPIKLLCDGYLAGIGTTVLYYDTAWLASIIVNPDYRNRGFGTKITEALVKSLEGSRCSTIFLIAMPLGVSIYKKAGFEVDTEYVAFCGRSADASMAPECIVAFQDKYTEDILQLDKKISGEDRSLLLKEHLTGAQVHIMDERIGGFYLPTLAEGPIVATNPESGIMLLQSKLQTAEKAMLPIDNEIGVEFFRSHRYEEIRRSPRMRLGKKRAWHPESIYSRISGAFG